MSEVLTEIAGVRLTVTGAAIALTILALLLFTICWLRDRKKRTAKPIHAGMLMNGIGFGLLPAMAVWKSFEELQSAGTGIAVVRPLPLIKWLSVGGYYVPCRIEIAAALVCFAAVCLWLILRKEALPDNGDLLLTGICLWALIRLVTEGLKQEGRIAFRYASCTAILFCLAVWTLRRSSVCAMQRRMIIEWLTAAACTAAIILVMNGIITAGSEIADLAVVVGCGLLMTVVILFVGSDLRRITPAEGEPQMH